VPPVDSAELVSVRLTVSADSTAASLAPLIVMVDDLGSAVERRHGERVGQRVAGIERLNRAVAVVEIEGPDAGRRHGPGAVAVVTCSGCPDCVNVLARLSMSVSVSVPVAVSVPAAALLTPPASVTGPVLVPDIDAGSLLPRILMVTDELVPSELVTAKMSV